MTTDNLSFYDVRPLAGALEAGLPILTPNHRLARRIRESWAMHLYEQGRPCSETPQVYALEHWLQNCYEERLLAGELLPRLVTPQQALELWQQVIEAHPDSSGLLRPRGAAQLAVDAYHNLLLWQVDWRAEPHASEFRLDADARLFTEWADAFEQRLQSSNLALLETLIPQLAGQKSYSSILLVEFGEVAPLHREYLQGQCKELLQHRNILEDAGLELQACENPEQELEQAAAWARELYEREPGHRIAILLPDLQQRLHAVNRVLEAEFSAEADLFQGFQHPRVPANISGGVSLGACRPVEVALALLSLPVREIELPQLVRLLHSRYRDGSGSAAEQQLLQKLYERGNLSVSSSLIRHECSRLDAQFSSGLELGQQLQQLADRRLLRERQSASAWTASFSEGLELLGWPGSHALDSEEYQQLDAFQQCLERLAELDTVCGPLDWRGALEKLEILCRETVFQAQTEDSRLQVLGMLEAAGLQFDALWITGMSSMNWPPQPTPNPFVPRSLQTRLGLPHAGPARELAYAESPEGRRAVSGGGIQ